MAKVDKFNVIRKRFFGDKGSIVGANLTEQAANDYINGIREAEPGEYTIVPVPDGWNKKEDK